MLKKLYLFNKVFIYKDTDVNDIGIYKITNQLDPNGITGRCVQMNNDGTWNDGKGVMHIQLGV